MSKSHVVLTEEQIEGLASLDAEQAKAALDSLMANPHIALMDEPVAQVDFVLTGTRMPVPDSVWKEVVEGLEDEKYSRMRESSYGLDDLAYKEYLRDEFGICEASRCDEEDCSTCSFSPKQDEGQEEEPEQDDE